MTCSLYDGVFTLTKNDTSSFPLCVNLGFYNGIHVTENGRWDEREDAKQIIFHYVDNFKTLDIIEDILSGDQYKILEFMPNYDCDIDYYKISSITEEYIKNIGTHTLRKKFFLVERKQIRELKVADKVVVNGLFGLFEIKKILWCCTDDDFTYVLTNNSILHCKRDQLTHIDDLEFFAGDIVEDIRYIGKEITLCESSNPAYPIEAYAKRTHYLSYTKNGFGHTDHASPSIRLIRRPNTKE